MINRNAYHNAMRCGTLFYYTAARRAAAPLDSTQLSDLFVTTQPSAALRNASRLCSTICFFILAPLLSAAQHFSSLLNDLFVISATQLCESHLNTVLRPANQLNDLFVINASLLFEPRHHSAQRFVYHNAPNRYAALGPSTQRNDLFVTTQCLSSRLPAAHRASTRLNAAQRFVCSRRLASLLYSTMRGETQHHSTQRNQPIGELNVPKITTNYKNMRYVS